MNWINEVKKELNEKQEAEKFIKSNSESIYEDIFGIAESEAEKVNQEIFDGKSVCKVSDTKMGISFAVVIEQTGKTWEMIVSFAPMDGFVQINRKLVDIDNSKTLPEKIAVRPSSNGYKITFEPEYFDGETETSEIENDLLAKMLIEPLVRYVVGLPQNSYSLANN